MRMKLIALVLLVAISFLAHADEFAPNHNRKAIRILAKMQAQGLIQSDELQMAAHSHRRTTRAMWARAAVANIPKYKGYFESPYPEINSWSLRTLQEDVAFLGSELEVGVRYWIAECSAQLIADGVDPDSLLRQFDECKPLIEKRIAELRQAIREKGGKDMFIDVPFDHWANHEIQELLDAGILKGYPDGKFRG